MQTLSLPLTWLAGSTRDAGLATPSPSMTVDPDAVTPGFVGFVAIAVIALVVVFLLIDMLRRIRRAGYRADINEQLDAEADAAADAASPAAPADPADRADRPDAGTHEEQAGSDSEDPPRH